jgi:hypothetical protein
MKKFIQKMSMILGLFKRPPMSKAAPLPIHCNHMFEALYSALLWIAQLIK